MTTTTAVRAPQHATTTNPGRYAPRSGIVLTGILTVGAIVSGSGMVLAYALAMALAAAALIWVLDVLSQRRRERAFWLAYALAVVTGGAVLALVYVHLERVLS